MPIGGLAYGSSTFITIFLAEMGDKTQLVTLLMSAESQSPWIVFIGAALALISTSLLGEKDFVKSLASNSKYLSYKETEE